MKAFISFFFFTLRDFFYLSFFSFFFFTLFDHHKTVTSVTYLDVDQVSFASLHFLFVCIFSLIFNYLH